MPGPPRPTPDDLTTHLDLGVAYAEMDLLDDAAAELELVLPHDPENATARATLALVTAKQGNPPDSGPIGAPSLMF